MEEDIKKSYLYYSTIKDMWDALTLAYSDIENLTQLLNFKIELVIWNKES